MIRPDKIKTALFGGVGFRQSPITEYAIVDASNQQSNSGLFYQDGTSLVTIKNIKESQQSIDISDADFNSYLKQLQENCIIEVCRALTANEPDFIQDVNMFPYQKSFKNVIDKRSKFVGFTFKPQNKLDTLGKVSYIELCFNEDVTFNIYMYNSNKPNTPIETLEVNALADEAVIVPLNWFLADSETYKGGVFYIGYFEDDLGTAQAYKKDYDLAQYQFNTKCFYSRPVSLDYNGTNIDVESVINESEEYGLNFIVSIYNDYTEILIRNKNLLWSAIQLQMGEKVLEVIKTSTRLNGNNSILDSEALINNVNFDLFGNEKLKIDGIKTKKQRQIDSIKRMLFYKPFIKRRTLR